WQVLPRNLCEALMVSARMRGASIMNGSVARVEKRKGRATGVVLEDGRRLSSDSVVLATGAWTSTIETEVGIASSIYPVPGQLLLLQQRRVKLRCCVRHGSMYVAPRADGTIVAGATEEPERGFNTACTAE